MKFLGLFILLSVSQSAFAKTTFLCKTNSADADGYYVKKEMIVSVESAKKVFVRPHDVFNDYWNDGGYGKFSKVNDQGFSVFNKFDSEELFGDLSEGVADSITLYVSPEVMKGDNGTVTLYARGSEVGLEHGTYSCRVK